MNGFDKLWVWDDPRTASALGWYRAVASNRMPAKFRIAATLPVSVSFRTCSEDDLRRELKRLKAPFLRKLALKRE